MNQKPMGKKATIISLVIVIAVAILLGAVLLHKGDGPVAGMILADHEMVDMDAYADAETTHNGVYLVLSNAFNQYQADYETAVARGETLYAVVHFVECPQGSAFTARWRRDDVVIAEEDGILATGPQGVISYTLDGADATGGSYTFALYQDGKSIFQYSFTIE